MDIQLNVPQKHLLTVEENRNYRLKNATKNTRHMEKLSGFSTDTKQKLSGLKQKLNGFSTNTKQKLRQMQERLIAISSRGVCIPQGETEIIKNIYTFKRQTSEHTLPLGLPEHLQHP